MDQQKVKTVFVSVLLVLTVAVMGKEAHLDLECFNESFKNITTVPGTDGNEVRINITAVSEYNSSWFSGESRQSKAYHMKPGQTGYFETTYQKFNHLPIPHNTTWRRLTFKFDGESVYYGIRSVEETFSNGAVQTNQTSQNCTTRSLNSTNSGNYIFERPFYHGKSTYDNGSYEDITARLLIDISHVITPLPPYQGPSIDSDCAKRRIEGHTGHTHTSNEHLAEGHAEGHDKTSFVVAVEHVQTSNATSVKVTSSKVTVTSGSPVVIQLNTTVADHCCLNRDNWPVNYDWVPIVPRNLTLWVNRQQDLMASMASVDKTCKKSTIDEQGQCSSAGQREEWGCIRDANISDQNGQNMTFATFVKNEEDLRQAGSEVTSYKEDTVRITIVSGSPNWISKSGASSATVLSVTLAFLGLFVSFF